MSVALSIIIPIYGVEKYLLKCIDSILTQTFSDFECILVDDCSIDNCPAICEDYAHKDTRIKVIHNNENIGSSLSRKTGLKKSSGEYILYIDGDDYIEPNMLEKLYFKAKTNDYDMVYCDFYNYEKTDGLLYEKVPILSDDIIKNIKGSILDFKPGAYVWNKLVKKSIYEIVEFPVDSVAEDKYISLQLIFFCKKIGYVEAALYNQQYNPTSITYATVAQQKYKEILNNFIKIIDFLKIKFGEDLSLFEPELGIRIKRIKELDPKNPIRMIKNIGRAIIPDKIWIWLKKVVLHEKSKGAIN
jgi:glycosyltransferase involved in cell wall biosynthesis